MTARRGNPDFAVFYDAVPGRSHEVASLYGVHWRSNEQESLVVVFRDSGTYGPEGIERSQEIILGQLGHRRNLASAVARGFFLVSEGKAPTTRLSYSNFLRPFFAFLDESDPDADIVSALQVDTSLVNRFVAWLSGQTIGSLDGSRKPMSKDYKTSIYAQLRYAMEALRRDGRDDLAADCSLRRNPWPVSKGMGAKRGLPNPAEILSEGHLRTIHEACRKEVSEVLSRFERGERLIAGMRGLGTADGSGLDLSELGGVLAAAERRYGGILPSMERLLVDDRGIHDGIRRHGGREAVLPFLVATPATLLPFIILLAMRTFFNTDALVGIRDSCCREGHWLWGGLDWEMMADDLSSEGQEELARLVSGGLSEMAATRLVLSSYKGRKHGMVTRSFRASSEWDSPPQVVTDVRRITSRLRAVAPEAWRDRLFLFQVPTRTSSAPRSFTARTGPSGDQVLATALRRFIERHGLARFNLGSFRLTGADVVWEATGGDASAVATMLGNEPRTASSHYDTPGNVKRAEHTLAVMTNRRARLIETGGRSRIEFTACTPGFHCTDPYDSPILGQAEGRLCSAYPACATCPLASLDRDRPDAVAWLLNLAEGIEGAAATMDPARYQAVYAPVLAALRGTWLPGVPLPVIREAEAIAARLPSMTGME